MITTKFLFPGGATNSQNSPHISIWPLDQSVLCDFCVRQEETNAHLFWEFWYILDLWSKIQGILTNNNIEIQLSYFTISFGVIFRKNKKSSIFNFIVLLVKYYIFVSKYKQQIPNINGFINLLQQTREFEEYIAFSKNKLDVHRKKWQLIRIT